MKRFWLILLSLGLIVAFSTSAMAVDVKVSGEYYAAGMYLDKTTLHKGYYLPPVGEASPVYVGPGPSTAFYFQRLRLNTTFVVSPGLMLITRADIMERAWGATRTAAGTAGDTMSAGTKAENENIAFDLAYVQYTSPIGIFLAGYQIDGAWGTVFGDTSQPTPKIGYLIKVGNVLAGVQAGKNPDGEKSYGTFNTSSNVGADRDNSFYTGLVKYYWKGGETGLLGKYIRVATNRNVVGINAPALGSDVGFLTEQYILVPYVKAQLGPVALQAEFTYVFGKFKNWEGTATGPSIPASLGGPKEDVDLSMMSAWIDATADFGMLYAGGTLAYLSGDDPSSTDKIEGTLITGGRDWNPCLIMFNQDLSYWVGSLAGYGVSNAAPMNNAFFAQLRGGVRPVDKLDIMASVSWAKAERDPIAGNWESKEYGFEVDLTATYKITNNLSYMLGGGYWFVGDYYQGLTSSGHDLDDNLMVINKLTLTF